MCIRIKWEGRHDTLRLKGAFLCAKPILTTGLFRHLDGSWTGYAYIPAGLQPMRMDTDIKVDHLSIALLRVR